MKKLIILCTAIMLILLPVASVIGCQQQAEPAPTVPTPSPPAKESKTYTNSEQGFSVEYPKNWRQVGLTGYAWAIWKIAFEETVPGIAPGVGIMKCNMEGKTLEEVHAEVSKIGVFASRSILSTDKVEINGLEAYITVFTEKSPEGTVKGKEMTITKDHKIAYCVDCYSLLSDYDRSEKNLDMIHNSFRIQ